MGRRAVGGPGPWQLFSKHSLRDRPRQVQSRAGQPRGSATSRHTNRKESGCSKPHGARQDLDSFRSCRHQEPTPDKNPVSGVQFSETVTDVFTNYLGGACCFAKGKYKTPIVYVSRGISSLFFGKGVSGGNPAGSLAMVHLCRLWKGRWGDGAMGPQPWGVAGSSARRGQPGEGEAEPGKGKAGAPRCSPGEHRGAPGPSRSLGGCRGLQTGWKAAELSGCVAGQS